MPANGRSDLIRRLKVKNKCSLASTTSYCCSSHVVCMNYIIVKFLHNHLRVAADMQNDDLQWHNIQSELLTVYFNIDVLKQEMDR